MATLPDGSHLKQAKTWIEEEADSDHADDPGFRLMLAEALIKLEQVHVMNRLADKLDEISHRMRAGH